MEVKLCLSSLHRMTARGMSLCTRFQPRCFRRICSRRLFGSTHIENTQALECRQLKYGLLQLNNKCGKISKQLSSTAGAAEERVSRTNDLMVASDVETEKVMLQDMLIYEDFISKEEENSILEEIEPYMRRLKYEFDHWDNAIHGYRETERGKWREENKKIIQRIRDMAFPPSVKQLAHVHILDIAKEGYIKPHVDAVRFCGNTIAGISLLSPAVMRLVHTDDKSKVADFLLKPRSIYVMKNDTRYKYTHEVLSSEESQFRGKVVPRDRRISIMCRNEPE